MSLGSPRAPMPVRGSSNCVIARCLRPPTGIHKLCAQFISALSAEPLTGWGPILIEPNAPRCNHFSSPGPAVWICFLVPRPPSDPPAELPDPGRYGPSCAPGRGSAAARPDRRKEHPSPHGRWLLAYVCLTVAGATWALPGVVAESSAYDETIHVVILGFTMITAIAIALAASGSQTRTVSCS